MLFFNKQYVAFDIWTYIITIWSTLHLSKTLQKTTIMIVRDLLWREGELSWAEIWFVWQLKIVRISVTVPPLPIGAFPLREEPELSVAAVGATLSCTCYTFIKRKSDCCGFCLPCGVLSLSGVHWFFFDVISRTQRKRETEQRIDFILSYSAFAASDFARIFVFSILIICMS